MSDQYRGGLPGAPFGGGSQPSAHPRQSAGLGNAAIIVAVIAIAFSLLSTIVTFMLRFATGTSVVGASWVHWVVAIVAVVAIVLGAIAWSRPRPGRLRGAVAAGVGCVIAIPTIATLVVTLALTL